MPLTDTAVRQAKPKAKPYKLADERGLYLLVNPGGSKLWRYKFRVSGKEKLLALGSYPDVSLRDARDQLHDARRDLAKGTDPSAARQQQKAVANGAHTFGFVAEEWYEHTREKWTDGHAVTIRSRLDRDVLPYLGGEPLEAINAPAMLALFQRVESRGAIETAHRIRTICSQVFQFAVAMGKAKENPAAAVPKTILKPVIPQKMAAITDPKEVGALLRAIDAYKGTAVVRAAFRLAPLVMLRPGELREAEWREFDLDNAQWIIPAQRMKLPKALKNDSDRSHIVPLSRQAIAILRDLRQLTGQDRYVFPGGRSIHRAMSENAITAALRRMGYDGNTMTWHGFRATASTLLNDENPEREAAIDMQLAHVKAKVSGKYNRAFYLPLRETIMQEWADRLDALKAGKDLTAKSAKRSKADGSKA